MIAAHVPLTASTHTRTNHTLDIPRLRGLLAAARDVAVHWLSQTLCGLRGHAMMLHFESTRLSLHCPNCGRTTPGWAIQRRR